MAASVSAICRNGPGANSKSAGARLIRNFDLSAPLGDMSLIERPPATPRGLERFFAVPFVDGISCILQIGSGAC